MCCVKCQRVSAVGCLWGAIRAGCDSALVWGDSQAEQSPPSNHLNEHSLLEFTHYIASLPLLPGTIPGTSDKTQEESIVTKTAPVYVVPV